jgi:DNA-binding NarL/FixJ family response regulator
MVAQIAEQHPDTKILVLGSASQGEVALNALRKGAQGHLIKGASLPEEIVTAIHAVRRGESVISPALAGAILDEISYRYQLARGRQPSTSGRENPTTSGR